MPFLKAAWVAKTKVEPAPHDDLPGACWLYQGARNQDGYAIVSIGPRKSRKLWRLHRWVIHNLGMPGPEDWQGDHLCYRRNCYQPLHLERVSGETNRERADCCFKQKDEYNLLSQADLAVLADTYWMTAAAGYVSRGY